MALVACVDSTPVAGVFIGCRGGAGGLACDTATAAADAAARFARAIGGQGTFVRLGTGGAATFDATLNRLNQPVTVRNLLDQPLGTTDGTTVANGGVRVFFASGPTNGVTVVNADGVGMFTGSNQRFFSYNEVLAPNATNRTSKTWTFQLPTASTTFEFQVYVYADRPDESQPLSVPPHTFASLGTSGSSQHTCAIRTGGQAYCWGGNDDGQVGDGTTTRRLVPSGVLGAGHGMAQLSTGAAHTCGLTTGGKVYCWGSNRSGQLGTRHNYDATSPNSVPRPPTPSPVEVGVSSVRMVSAGGGHTCAVSTGGALSCWGEGFEGQLGRPHSASNVDPAGVPASDVRTVSAGASHTCAVTESGALYCWGDNVKGQTGPAVPNAAVWTPKSIAPPQGETGFSAVAAGGLHTCGLTTAGRIYCWGDNFYGQLGTSTGKGTSNGVSTPQLVLAPGVAAFTALALGRHHSCALTDAGQIYCWGDNGWGQTAKTDPFAPAEVPGAANLPNGVTRWSSVIAGYGHTCGLANTGVGYCWGLNSSGEKGNGGTTTSAAQTAVSMP